MENWHIIEEVQPKKTMSESLNADGFGNDSENNVETTNSPKGVLERTDRNEETHEFVEFKNRLSGGEKYIFALLMYSEYGEKMGNSPVKSTVYSVEDDRFPNKAIGQSEENPGGNWEDAESPLAFLYSRYAAKKAKEAAKDEFYNQVESETDIDSDDITIEDYKASFPVRKAVWMDNPEMVRVSDSPIESRSHKQWEDFYLPAEWVEAFGMEDIPVFKDEIQNETETEEEPEEEESSTTERGNYEDLGNKEQEQEDNMDIEELQEKVQDVDLSSLRTKKEKIAAIVTEVPEFQGSLPGDVRVVIEDHLDTSSSTIYEGQKIALNEGDPREETETEEQEDEQETETEDETMTEDNNETQEVGKAAKYTKLAIQEKPERVLELLMENNGDMVLSQVKAEYEEELEETFGSEEVDEEEVVDDMLAGL